MNIPRRASYIHPRWSAKSSLTSRILLRLVLASAEPGEGKPLTRYFCRMITSMTAGSTVRTQPAIM